MFKIYFAPAWDFTSEQMVDDYRRQTPGQLPKWRDMEVTFDVKSADYLIIQDYCDERLLNEFDPKNIYCFARETIGLGRIDDYSGTGINIFSWRDRSSYLYVKWTYPNNWAGVNKTYDELNNTQSPPDKNKILSSIQSNKNWIEGHLKRLKFLKEFISRYPDKLDLFGGISFSNSILPDNNKMYALDPYKYNIAFDNTLYLNYFATQFTDAILSWSVPIFWGCPNLNEYFPEKSYIKFNVDDMGEIERIIDIIKNDTYTDRINDLREARQLILDKYNLWSTIYRAITEGTT